ncbi:MAG: hypothetical protein ACTSQA_04660, partial [Candidatus Heimdallarchaeaceae archaeon]
GGQLEYVDHLNVFFNTVPLTGDRLFTIPTPTRQFLEVPAEDKKYENQDLSANLIDLFRSRNAIPRLERTHNALTFYEYNYRNNPITVGSLTGQRKEKTFSNFASSVRSKLNNITFEGSIIAAGTWFPSETGSVVPRSSSNKYTDANAQWQLDRGIRRKVEAYIVDYPLKDYPNPSDTTFIDLDISAYVFDKEEWEGLEIGSNNVSTLITSEQHQRNSIYFTLGGTTIDGLGNSFDSVLGLKQFTMDMLIQSVLEDHATYTDANYTDRDIIENQLRIFFNPFIDADITSDKQTGVTKRSTMGVNQKDKIVDLGRQANVLKGTINRLANNNYQITKVHDEIADCFDIGDYTANDFVVTKINYLIFSNQVKATYDLTQNFNNLDGQTSVKGTTDPFTITNEQVKSNFIYKEYLQLSDTFKNVTGNLTVLGFKALFNGLDFLTADDKPLYNAEYNSDDATLGSSERISMSATAIGVEGGIKVFTEFTSPLVAGNQVIDDTVLITTGYKMKPVLYTDEGGGATDIDINFVNASTVVSNDYPIVVERTSETNDILLQFPSTNIYLQPNEILGVTQELSFLNKDNFLLFEGFANVYTEFDKQVKDVQSTSTSFTVTKSTHKIDVSSISGTDTATWAIADSNGVLWLAVNYVGTSHQVVYINNILDDGLLEL